MANETRRKLREAEHFLDQMIEAFDDDAAFAHNLSAFVSAARSITFFMQKQYKAEKGFPEWYCLQRDWMIADQELDYLDRARVDTIHVRRVPTGATRQGGLIARAVIAPPTTGSELRETSSEESTAAPQIDAQPPPSVVTATTAVRRFFSEFGQVEVPDFCRRQLEKLSRLVDDCEGRFLHRPGADE